MRSWRPSDPWSIAAVLCLGGGGVLLLIAWYDISGTADLYKQMPYLVSAGFTGLGVIILGSALIVAGRHDRVERRLAQLLDAITEAVEEDGAAPETADAAEPAVNAPESYLTVPEGTTYHRPDCLLLRDKHASAVDPEALASGALAPCPVCLPETTEQDRP